MKSKLEKKRMSFLQKPAALGRIVLVGWITLGLAGPLAAQTDQEAALEDVRAQIAAAMEAIAAYSEAQREAAIADARAALDELDAAIAERQREMRADWAEMTAVARADADARLAELQTALVGLAERVGMLQAGADTAWDELNSGLVAAWDALSSAIEASLQPVADAQ
jgi:hypothetical protein